MKFFRRFAVYDAENLQSPAEREASAAHFNHFDRFGGCTEQNEISHRGCSRKQKHKGLVRLIVKIQVTDATRVSKFLKASSAFISHIAFNFDNMIVSFNFSFHTYVST